MLCSQLVIELYSMSTRVYTRCLTQAVVWQNNIKGSCVFVCVLSSRCLVCRPSHLCVCRGHSSDGIYPPTSDRSRACDTMSTRVYTRCLTHEAVFLQNNIKGFVCVCVCALE